MTSSSPFFTSILLALLGVLPFALVVMTSFSKIVVVFSILRSALGTQNVPPGTVVTSLAVILTAFVMEPVATPMLDRASPLLAATPEQLRDLAFLGDQLDAIVEPWRRFLAANSGSRELELFAELRGVELPASRLEVPLWVAVPAFTLTELAEAFEIGFLLFLPFIVLDMLVGSVLLSLGMHMLSPTAVSMPFKLLLFVLVDGWLLLSRSLIVSYVQPGGV